MYGSGVDDATVLFIDVHGRFAEAAARDYGIMRDKPRFPGLHIFHMH